MKRALCERGVNVILRLFIVFGVAELDLNISHRFYVTCVHLQATTCNPALLINGATSSA